MRSLEGYENFTRLYTMETGAWNPYEPLQALRGTCGAQNGDAEGRKTFYALGFSQNDIEQTGTMDLATETVLRVHDVMTGKLPRPTELWQLGHGK
jgi:hypothetical protein